MTDRVYIVRKVPDTDVVEDFDGGDYSDCGIYPSGEIMSVFETREKADDYTYTLRKNSPSDRFGETMEDAPYQFFITGYEAVS